MRGISCLEAAGLNLCLQVQETRDRLTGAGRKAWTSARAGGEKVMEGPKTLMALFGGRRRSGWERAYHDGEDEGSDGISSESLLAYRSVTSPPVTIWYLVYDDTGFWLVRT